MISYTRNFIFEAYGEEAVTEVKLDGNWLIIVNINNLFAYVFSQSKASADRYDKIAKKKVRKTRRGDNLYLRLMSRRVYIKTPKKLSF